MELKNADANGVIASINTGMVQFLLENWKSQTVAFGSDGASVYVGRLNGVVAKLRAEIPWLLGVHCVAHRLELMCKRCSEACTSTTIIHPKLYVNLKSLHKCLMRK